MRNKLALIARNDTRTKALYEFLAGNAYAQVELNPTYPKDSIVVSSEFNKSLDPSNQLVLLARGDKLTSKERMFLPNLKGIIAHTQSAAYKIAWQVKATGFATPIISLLPYVTVPKNITPNKSIYYDNLGPVPDVFFNKYKIQNINPNAKLRIDLSEPEGFPYHILESMAMGVPPVVWDQPPYSDFIIHGHNGYLIQNTGELSPILDAKDHSLIAMNARNTINSIYNPIRYYNSLIKRPNNLNILSKIKLEHEERKWIVRERIFKGNEIEFFPKDFNPLLQEISLNNVEEVLEHFSGQNFSDVYVFGCDFPTHLEPEDINRIRGLINQLGPYKLKLHFCIDYNLIKLSDEWIRLCSKLSLISVQEGLKQVSR